MIGQRAPFARITVRDGKIIDYLLNVGHSDGGQEAWFFLARSFRLEEPNALAAALCDHVRTHVVVSVRYRPQGPLVAVEGMQSPRLV